MHLILKSANATLLLIVLQIAWSPQAVTAGQPEPTPAVQATPAARSALPLVPVDKQCTIVLKDGRQLTGTIDQRSNANVLWLARGTRNARVIRAYRWNQIAKITMADASGHQTLQPQELQHIFAKDKPSRLRVIRLVHRPTEKALSEPIRPSHTVSTLTHATTLVVDARASNWDADPADDGIELWVHPTNKHGNLVKADGLLQVELYATRTELLYANRPPQRIGYWTRQISKEQFNTGGLCIHLPYQVITPQTDLRWNAIATLKVRFSIPGQKVLEASIPFLRLREFDPVRDWLLLGGRRSHAVWPPRDFEPNR